MEIKSYNIIEALESLCFYSGQYGLYLSYHGDEDFDELSKAAPYLSEEQLNQLFLENHIYLLGSKGDITSAYCQTVGDDGPTKLNDYNGPCKIYALLVNNLGVAIHENT